MESYEKSKSSLQETIDKLNYQMKSFEEKMKRVEESILSRDYKKHIQDYGSPSQFWEQELESLHFVIEMKNERIHHLDKKLLNLETVMERNLLLEEKVKTLQQENEDLQVRMQNHITVTSVLSGSLYPWLLRSIKENKLQVIPTRELSRKAAHQESNCKGRWYLREGWLTVVPAKGETLQHRMFFLFSDALLMTKPYHPLHPWNSNKLACQEVFQLQQCSVEKVFGHTQSHGGLLSLSFPHKKLLLMSYDQEDLNKWHQSLTAAVRAQRPSQMSLAMLGPSFFKQRPPALFLALQPPKQNISGGKSSMHSLTGWGSNPPLVHWQELQP
ncbi:hypothetical protein JD844_012278 [Phrynosoma platyrhinos]|uniref:PH domain-containing protein n=1 Tax=Phrynosoma platyrhinos TaxID=52577 RepID=A0ABQ7TK64_PHRPL|nr:hypothetical protein JD844_012278 [Phrynosoma platyrhinos]